MLEKSLKPFQHKCITTGAPPHAVGAHVPLTAIIDFYECINMWLCRYHKCMCHGILNS